MVKESDSRSQTDFIPQPLSMAERQNLGMAGNKAETFKLVNNSNPKLGNAYKDVEVHLYKFNIS